MANIKLVDNYWETSGIYDKVEGKTQREVNSDLKNTLTHKADAIYDTASGDIASFPDGADGLPVKDLTVAIEPVQDLHGYDNPWPAGGGKNLLDPSKKESPIGGATYRWYETTGLQLHAGQAYTFSCESSSVRLYFRRKSDGTDLLTNASPITYTPSEDVVVFLQAYKSAGITETQFQLELGSTATSYAPYSNICPISGCDSLTVTRAGKNLFGGVYDEFFPLHFNVDTQVTASADTKGGNGNIQIAFYDSNKSQIDYWGLSAVGTRDKKAFTYPATAYYVKFIRTESTNYQIELGSPETTYEPYTGTTLPISWQSSAGTVYGGTLDVTSGVLTVDRAIVDLGTLNWVEPASANPHISAASVNNRKYGTDVASTICSAYKFVGSRSASWFENNLNNGEYGFQTTQRTMRLRDDRFSTQAEFKAGLSGVYMVYPIATHLIVPLDPVTVTILLGQNNIWADTGDSTVEYPCDTKLYIQKINTPTDDDMIADANIANDKYFIINNNLYLSTTAILAGDPIKPGTNCTLTNLAAALNAINS